MSQPGGSSEILRQGRLQLRRGITFSNFAIQPMDGKVGMKAIMDLIHYLHTDGNKRVHALRRLGTKHKRSIKYYDRARRFDHIGSIAWIAWIGGSCTPTPYCVHWWFSVASEECLERKAEKLWSHLPSYQCFMLAVYCVYN